MRHFRSILYALVLAPAVWVLAGVGLTHDLTTRGRDDFAVESITGLLLLVLAGAAYAILVFAPISPAGPTLAGLAYLGVAIWALQAPSAYAGVWPPDVAKEGFDLSRPGYGLAALLAVPLIGTALSARRWARYEPPVLPIIGQIGRARGAAPVAGTPIAAVETALLPGRRTDPDPTTVLRLPQPNGTATLVASSGADTTVIHTDDATVAFSSDRTVVVDAEETATVAGADSGSGPGSGSGSGSDEPTEVVADAGETVVVGEAETDEPTAVVAESARAAAMLAGAGAEESSETKAQASASKASPKPDRTAGPALDPEAAGGQVAEGSQDEEPTVVTPAAAESQTATVESQAALAESQAAAVEDETTRTLDLPDSETTRTLDAPDPEMTRPIPFPRAVPPAERFDDAEEPARTLRAVDSDRTRDLGNQSSDAERTEVIRLPVGDQAERTQVVRLPPSHGPTTYRPGEQTRIIPFPGTGDAGGDDTQIIRLPVRPNEGENTQVIRPGLVEPPPERTEVIRFPLRRADDADETEEQAKPAPADGPASIAEAEAPDISDDPTSRLEPPNPRTDQDSQRSMTVMNMERPPEN